MRTIAPLALLMFVAAASAADKSIPLPGGATAHLAVPDGWTATVAGGRVPTVTVTGPADRHAMIKLTMIPLRRAMSDAQLKSATVAAAQQYVGSSKEQKATPEVVKGDGTHGYVCSFTDAAADPGEFRCVTSGAVAVGDAALGAITILSDDNAGPAHAAAMGVLTSLKVDAPKAAAAGPLRLASPDGKWAVVVPGHWTAGEGGGGNGQQVEASATDPAGGWVASVFVEPAANPGDAKAARAFYVARMKRNPIPMTNVKRRMVGDAAVVGYDQDVNHNVNVYLSHGGQWVDVHLSKTSFDPAKDWAALDAIVKGIKVGPTADAGQL